MTENKRIMRCDGHTVILLGPPHSGKSTIAALLADRASFQVFDLGARLREIIANEPTHAEYETIKRTVESGGLLSDALAERLFSEAAQPRSYENLVTDGFPRTQGAVDLFVAALTKMERSIGMASVVNLHVEEDSIEGLIKGRGRQDDLDDSIVARRISNFSKNIGPTLDRLNRVFPVLNLDFNCGAESNFATLMGFLSERKVACAH